MTALPLILAGPLVRRVTPEGFALWLVASRPLELRLQLSARDEVYYDAELQAPALVCLRLGERAFAHLIQVGCDLPPDSLIQYQLLIQNQGEWRSLFELLPELSYGGALPRIPVARRLREVWHGSCRLPHFEGRDALAAADQRLEARAATGEAPPDLLLLTGDQVYVDELCGPMLLAIHQLIAVLGLPLEHLPDGRLIDETSLYRRRELLPRLQITHPVAGIPIEQPVFVSPYCDNHLLGLSEMIALYLLSWSPAVWTLVKLPQAQELAQDMKLSRRLQARYRREQATLEAFVRELPRVRRALAQLPSYMIFDDHEVSDDWNLSQAWQKSIYDHVVTRRMVGNALCAYWLCQGWGNHPGCFKADFWAGVSAYCQQPSEAPQAALVEQMLGFQHWQYQLETFPKLIVLDTRTRRWPATRADQPAGLLGPEAFAELEGWLTGQERVLLVSATPVYGVRLVEALQHVFNLAGHTLTADVENWRAHPEAFARLQRLLETVGREVVILSGDVHFSFVEAPPETAQPRVWQLTASGLKNAFPYLALKLLEILDGLLFKSHRMQAEAHELIDDTAIGIVCFEADGALKSIQLLTGEGQELNFKLK